MSGTTINLTKIAIAQEIEDMLETYPTCPYQQLFSMPDRRQALTAYVLDRISSCYMTPDQNHHLSECSSLLSNLQREKACREALIRQGIEEILQDKLLQEG